MGWKNEIASDLTQLEYDGLEYDGLENIAGFISFKLRNKGTAVFGCPTGEQMDMNYPRVACINPLLYF